MNTKKQILKKQKRDKKVQKKLLKERLENKEKQKKDVYEFHLNELVKTKGRPIYNDPVQEEARRRMRQEKIESQLERNMEILEELEKEIEAEEEARQKLNEELERQGAHTLEEKLKFVNKKVGGSATVDFTPNLEISDD